MEKVIDYRNHAVECRELAQRARSPDEREMLLNMAASWDNLADSRERSLASSNQDRFNPNP
jgi:hypothetical protein